MEPSNSGPVSESSNATKWDSLSLDIDESWRLRSEAPADPNHCAIASGSQFSGANRQNAEHSEVNAGLVHQNALLSLGSIWLLQPEQGGGGDLGRWGRNRDAGFVAFIGANQNRRDATVGQWWPSGTKFQAAGLGNRHAGPASSMPGGGFRFLRANSCCRASLRQVNHIRLTGRLGGRQPAETHHRHIRAMLSGTPMCANGVAVQHHSPGMAPGIGAYAAGFACRLGSTVPERTALAGSGAQMVQNRLDALLERSAYGQHRKLGMLGEDRREDLLGPGPGV